MISWQATNDKVGDKYIMIRYQTTKDKVIDSQG